MQVSKQELSPALPIPRYYCCAAAGQRASVGERKRGLNPVLRGIISSGTGLRLHLGFPATNNPYIYFIDRPHAFCGARPPVIRRGGSVVLRVMSRWRNHLPAFSEICHSKPRDIGLLHANKTLSRNQTGEARRNGLKPVERREEEEKKMFKRAGRCSPWPMTMPRHFQHSLSLRGFLGGILGFRSPTRHSLPFIFPILLCSAGIL